MSAHIDTNVAGLVPDRTIPDRRPERTRVAVVGGGAGGTIAAVHLLRAADRPLEVLLIDAAGSFGPGVPYATRDPLHLLNVAASRMGAIAGQPEHFHAWLRRRGHSAGPDEFLPRGLFGAYLRGLLDETESEAAPAARLRRITAEVTALAVPAEESAPLALTLANGERLEAEQAVLAVGPLPGGDPIQVPGELRRSGAYVPDPWAPDALDAARDAESVLMIGTGLTMVDLALTLCASERGPRVRAISRHGLLPRRHRAELTRLQRFPVPLEEGRLEPVVAAVIEQIGRVSQQGGDWRDVLDSFRSSTPAVWRALRVEERRRFLETLQRFWEVHRFRMAPDVADRFEALVERGRIQVDARSIVALEPRGGGARVSLHSVGHQEVELCDVDQVINCTGAGCDVTNAPSPLLRGLLSDGLARADELGLGLDVSRDGGLLDASGRPSERVRVIGQLRRGAEWEAIGVTEIRDHAAAVASALFATVERPARVA